MSEAREKKLSKIILHGKVIYIFLVNNKFLLFLPPVEMALRKNPRKSFRCITHYLYGCILSLYYQNNLTIQHFLGQFLTFIMKQIFLRLQHRFYVSHLNIFPQPFSWRPSDPITQYQNGLRSKYNKIVISVKYNPFSMFKKCCVSAFQLVFIYIHCLLLSFLQK